MITAVDRLFEDAKTVIATLGGSEETLSLQVSTGDSLRKVILMAAASYFEFQVCRTVIQFVYEKSNQSSLVTELVRNKAVSRQYHTWFAWDKSNANHFFGLFGADFRNAMSLRLEESTELRDSITAFLEIGNDRNRLVHQDFATFPLDKTLEEIYEKYKEALIFVEVLPELLRTSIPITQA